MMICLAHKCQPASTTTLKSKVERGVIIWDSMNMPHQGTQKKKERTRLEKMYAEEVHSISALL